MALLPFYRHRFFDDPFFFHRLDFFDPWFDFDLLPPFARPTSAYESYKREDRLTYSTTNTTNNANRSIERPPSPPPLPIPPPEKFHVQLDIDGFNPDTIKKRIEGRKLIVEGKQEEHRNERNYSSRQMRETYDLPENADPSGLTSYVAPNKKLVIEVPFRSSQSDRRLESARNDNRSLARLDQYRGSSYDNVQPVDDSALQPRIIDRGNNQKQLEVTVGVNNYRPPELKVSVKDNELIVQGEHEYKDQNRSERSYFFKSTTLPRGTQIDQLQSQLDNNGQLRIEGPVF